MDEPGFVLSCAKWRNFAIKTWNTREIAQGATRPASPANYPGLVDSGSATKAIAAQVSGLLRAETPFISS
jgi:hypothetical protein